MEDPFKTRKMRTIPVPEPSAEPATSERSPIPPSSGRPPLSRPPTSDAGWAPGMPTADRSTEPVMLAAPPVAPSGKDRATLTVLSGFSAGQVFALDGTEHVMGRGSDADVWIDDVGVSRRHARIRCGTDGRYLVEDLGSTNGTFVNGARVDACEIRPGDRVQAGPNVSLRFQITDDAEEELQRRLYEASTRDPLTRVYNRKYFSERLTAEVAYSRRHRIKLAVMIIDLDDFKSKNDTYGHLAGDMVLRVVSAQMQRLIRVEDLLARYGGEEFVVLARTTGKTDAARLAERIRETVSQVEIPVTRDRSIRTTVSIGVAALPDLPDGGPNELLALADARLYRAKREGKNRVVSDGEA